MTPFDLPAAVESGAGDAAALDALISPSQAETERILNEHRAANGVRVERGVELVDFRAMPRTSTARSASRE